MEYKFVNVTDSVQVPVPIGLSPDEEANFIASRIAFVDFEKLEAECLELVQQWEAGKLIPLETVLEEVEKEESTGRSHS